MEENQSDKIVIFATHGSEDPELATIPFVMGIAALAMDVTTTIVLQAEGVTLVQKGRYESISAKGFEPLKKFVDTFLELGGSILACIPCLQARDLTQDMLVDGTHMVKGARIIQESLEANTVINY